MADFSVASLSSCICRVLYAPGLSSVGVGLRDARNWIHRGDIHLSLSQSQQ